MTRVSEEQDKPLEHQELSDLDTWSRDIDVLAAAIPPDDFSRLEAALAEADKDAKALVRTENWLSVP
jgi:hypothetical protein